MESNYDFLNDPKLNKRLNKDLNKDLNGALKSIGQSPFQNSAFGKFAGGSSGFGSMIGNGLAGLGSAIGNKYGDDFSDEQKASQAAIRKGLEKIPVVGQLISAASGLVDGIGSMTGTNLSNVNKSSAQRAGIGGSAKFNNVMNMLPGNSMLWGMFGKRTTEAEKSDYIDGMAGGYADAVADIDAAGDVGQKRLLFGGRKANRFINAQNDKNRIMTDISVTNTQRKSSDYANDIAQQNINRYAGSNYNTYVGKTGLKLPSLETVRWILKKQNELIPVFKKGGTIGVDSNIIPEGMLHARLHHLDKVNPELEDVTKKGIPVVAVNEDGEIKQIAEIEHSEIILRLELTKQIEELMEDGSDEAAIKAGKLLAKELIINTEDKTNLLENGEK